ncbi:unnamed protein product [Rotaria sordida]|uniref:Poly [ADP-ribose] polymerase n=1 Tax=Rotaria sordida TaxID=392033 RepID=A0A815FBZ3_9BILA|nr:unnamed protein product [Rotaria sordida]
MHASYQSDHIELSIELSGAARNFLASFQNKILDTICKQSGIKDTTLKNGKLQLVGNQSAITNIQSYLKQLLPEQDITIANKLKKYLQSCSKGLLLKNFVQKYRVGIFYHEISTDASVTTNNNENDSDQDENQSEDDENDDSKSSSSRASSTAKSACGDAKRSHVCVKKYIRIALCSDSKDSLYKAIKELESYNLRTQSWTLTQEEISYILKQPQQGKPPQKNTTFRNQCSQIKRYLLRLVQALSNITVQMFVFHKNGVWRVKVLGFPDHVSKAMSKIKNCLDDNVESEVQLPISKTMAVFLRKKASSDIRKLEKTHRIKITIFLPFYRKRGSEEQDDDDGHDCLKLIGCNSRINLAKENVENFLESLSEQEKHFSCGSWDHSRNIAQNIRPRLTAIQNSDDCEAIGWIKVYTATERRETTPKITVSIVGLNEEAINGVVEQCQNIVDGYVEWKPTADEYRTINTALNIKKSPSIADFQKQWDTDVRLDGNKNTIIISARSKVLADDIKEALLSLGEVNKPRVKRISEFIPIQPNIRRFVNHGITALLNEAKSQKIFVEYQNYKGVTINCGSDIINEIKQKIDCIINDIKQKIVKSRLQLSSAESDLIRADAYKLACRIERETKTIIRDVNADNTNSTLNVNDNDTSSIMITVVNNRGQTIVVEKGDITKAKNVDAIVSAANGPLYHAGGVDKAIADAAGPALDQECKQLIAGNKGSPFPAGTAVKTTAGNLLFKCVIHAIGPQYKDGKQQEHPLLFSTVLSSLRLAEDEKFTSVALPAISANTYGFPLRDCTNIVVCAIKQFFADFPKSNVRKVILLDMDDAACNSFAREVVVDHRNTLVSDEDNYVMPCKLPSLKASWKWQDNDGEKLYCEHDMRSIETAFQQYLNTWTTSELIIGCDNLTTGTIVNYQIHFNPDLKQILKNKPNALNSRLVCGYQLRPDTGTPRDIIRYPVVQEEEDSPSVVYQPKPLDSYNLQAITTETAWDITGITNESVKQAEAAIRKAIDTATISEPFSINLSQDLEDHKEQLIKIAAQQQIEINFEQECSEQLQMTLKGLKANVFEAKLKIALYAQDILKTHADNADELCPPEEWGNQETECKLVEIPRDDPNFIRIETRMKETLDKVKIDKIERVQNMRMWSHYAFLRRELKKELHLMPNLQIERELFHGTNNTQPSEIYSGEYGFDMTFCTSGRWGIGTYFAQNASYSCKGYAFKLPNGKRQVFLAQVLTADVYDCPSEPSLRRPPKKNESISGRRYNSVSGDTGGSKVYIVYENRVAYPAYLITFTC